ncbi:hypothetical protein [Desulfobacula sp.]|uniref:hypothetical protein n=1 Tax=Desulfobacula sp. TaxID=2593537 RepID=UPI0025C6AAB5|nr:hypothetical protein [Desulfobacula sp.]MBC2703509.1 hypothetical protein [Desulfobacula sp.]
MKESKKILHFIQPHHRNNNFYCKEKTWSCFGWVFKYYGYIESENHIKNNIKIAV